MLSRYGYEFVEGVNNYQGLYSSLSDDNQRVLLTTPLYNTFAGAIAYNATSEIGYGNYFWAATSLDHLEYAYRFTLYLSKAFAAPYYLRIHGYSLREPRKKSTIFSLKNRTNPPKPGSYSRYRPEQG